MRAGTRSSSTVCPRPSVVVSARRCRNARGRALCSSRAANDERLFDWHLHLIRAPLHEVTVALPPGAQLIGDIPPLRSGRLHHWSDELAIRTYRRAIKTVHRQAEKMGIQRLHARANAGFALKVIASLIALAITNAD